ncbi:hypothetical protein AMATHDRAFT_127208, partial [Amanita thiersii Skay4041]
NVEELWKWTLTADAVAPCFVRDVMEMKENLVAGIPSLMLLGVDFFWLGRVPCRSVLVVGLVVGIQVYENKIVYTVDDGTAVVDCAQRIQGSKNVKPPSTTKTSATRTTDPTANTTTSTNTNTLTLPKPITRIGLPVNVVGKIQHAFGSRQIVVNQIEVCKSANDELLHWRRVRELHKTHYSLTELFVIPPPAEVGPATPKRAEPSTPSTRGASPVSSIASSPVKPRATKQGPPRLRHPSRLRSQDLTDNTFRIYVKHYMLYASDVPAPSAHMERGSDGNDTSGHDLESTTTTTTTRQGTADQERTPRPAKDRQSAVERTPRPRIKPVNHGASNSCDVSVSTRRGRQTGFTISYLRRVPELADMARRVVIAEAKRRMTEQRRNEKEGRSRSKGVSHRPPITGTMEIIPKEKIPPKMKRLFRWVVVHLLNAGEIVVWDGPMRACSRINNEEISGLWKSGSTSYGRSVGADSTVFSTSNRISQVLGGEEMEGEVSDCGPGEEGYLPVTPALLGYYVEKVMEESELKAVNARRKTESGVGRTPRLGGGITKEDILSRLHRDDRWRFIGEWQVEEALEYLRMKSRVWCPGQERWEL